MRLNALWWWIDRWRKSTAYTDMTLEEQGAYRNLLDEANLRGGAIPDDERILAKACGDALAWHRVRDRVLSRLELRADGWHHSTLDEVIIQSVRRAEAQAAYRARSGNPVAKTDTERKARYAARQATRRAVVIGRLKQLDCAVCGAQETEAHHKDYRNPLDVVWLCKPHHDERHRTHQDNNKDNRRDTKRDNKPDSPSPSPSLQDQDQERKSVSSAPHKPAAAEPAILTFPVVGLHGPGQSWALTEAQLRTWSTCYPNLDILAESRKALAWIEADLSRRKTVRGMPRFLVSWFARAVDRPSSLPHPVGSLKTAGNLAALQRFAERGQR